MVSFLDYVFRYYLNNFLDNKYKIECNFLSLSVSKFNALILMNFLRHKLKNGILLQVL